MWSTLKGVLTPPIIIGTVAVVAVISVGVTFFLTSEKPAAAYVTPTMGPLVQEVDTTGSVNAAQEINLGFQIGGSISDAGPAVGTHVGVGATLGALSSASLQASVEQAEAALQVQEANLSSLQAGATPQSLAVSQTTVTNAQASLTQAEQSLLATAEDAYAKSDDAIVNRVDQFMTNPHTATPSLKTITLSDSQDQASIVSGRYTNGNTLEQLAAVSRRAPERSEPGQRVRPRLNDPQQSRAGQLVFVSRRDRPYRSPFLRVTTRRLSSKATNRTWPLVAPTFRLT